MNLEKINILFVLAKNRLRKDGKAPLYCRITFSGKRKQFATGLFVIPKHWNNKQQRAKIPDKNSEYINSKLSLISQKINKAFLQLQVKGLPFDEEDIYLAYKGKNIKKDKTLLDILRMHNERMEKLVGKEYSPKYLQKYKGTHTLLKEFLKTSYGKNDILLSSLNLKFIDDLDYFLKDTRNQKQITINKCIQRVRRIVRVAISEGFLEKDPFILYQPKRFQKEVIFLDKDELAKIENHIFAQRRLAQVRDMFVFCCYTGLAYQEMSSLHSKHLIEGYDGNLWISMFRKKTGKQFTVPLLDKAIGIIEKYNNELDGKLLPPISNQKFNSYIKEIAEIVGVEKKISHHIARKTFATTVLLYNDVPMEIVSELLGHSKIGITQEHYAKVVRKKLSEQMKKVSKKLKKWD